MSLGRNKKARVCLVCRIQNRHCNNDCKFGEFFEPQRNEDFKCALRSLGLSNMMRIMGTVQTHERQAAAISILKQGRAWQLRHGRQLGKEISSSERKQLLVSTFMVFYRYYAQDAPFPIPRLRNQLNSSMSSLDIKPTGDMSSMELMESYKMDGIPTTVEIGESSNAFKGKQVIIEENDSEASDSEECLVEFVYDWC